MPCYGPLQAWYPKRLLSNGAPNPERRLVFRKDQSETGIPLRIPCGKCAGCRLEQSRQWAVRCMHEKRLHDAAAFVTLTYDDKHLPPTRTLVLEHYQNFMKRLRNDMGAGVRFFGCGEYGEQTSRPHYHLLLLNQDFTDKRLVSSGSEYNLYASPRLSQLWTFGSHVLGDVTFQSASYVARYCVKKKQNGRKITDGRLPEFVTMSRRPGLGKGYFDRFKSELLDHDTVIVNGVPAALPRFYDNQLAGMTGLIETREGHLLSKMELIKFRRRRKITWAQRRDNTTSRLRVREAVALAKLNLKKRTL